MQLLARWLNAKYYKSQYKPVPVEEFLVCDHKIYPASTSRAFSKVTGQLQLAEELPKVKPIRIVRPSEYKDLKNPVSNAVVSLAVETVEAGFGALVFCSARQGCQSTAFLVSEAISVNMETAAEVLDQRKNVISELRSLSIGLDELLEKTIIKGVAFHRLLPSLVLVLLGWANVSKMLE